MTINNRTFRVFVSSTFSDLKEERNALQKDVFPKLQKLCREKGCSFQAIDLRWGVNNEATLDHKTMDICLKEIARCQETRIKPNFIVLLGNRYGWRPLPARINNAEFTELSRFVSADDMALLDYWYLLDNNALYDLEGGKEVGVWTLKTISGDFEDWETWEAEEKKLHSILLAAVNQTSFSPEQRLKYTASATEQEIVNGALNVENAQEHVFCYFRDIAGLPIDENSKDFVDLVNDNGTWRTDTEAQQHLVKLKNDSLRNRLGSNIRDYPAGWSGKAATTDHIPHLCEHVLNDLKAVIESEIDQMQEDDPLEREVAVHQEFGVDRAKFFTGRITELDEISAYIENNEKNPLLIHGESGTGKSALMAKAVEICGANHPDAVLVQRFIGASAGSSSGGTLLQDLCKEICRKYDVDESDVASDYWDLTKEFHRRLTYAKADKPLVVFIDALDQLSEINDQADLSWLTPGLPDNVKIIISSIPGPWLESAQNRLTFGRSFELKEMNSGEADQLLDYWLHDADRTLTADQKREVLAKFTENGLPLYLKLAFEEAKLWKSFTPPSETELHPETEGIIRGLFKRLSKNSNHGSLMVSRSLGYLAASRYGLSEEEILEILSRDQDLFTYFLAGIHHELPEKKLPIVVWSRLYHDLEEYLTVRDMDGIPLIDFYHRQLREVVEAEYIDASVTLRYHLHLADYFETLDLCDRKIVELPWQLQESEAWEMLYNLLADLPFFAAAWNKNEFEMISYWVKVENNTSFSKVEAYQSIIKNPSQFGQLAGAISVLFYDTGNPSLAQTLWEYLIDYYYKKDDRERVQICMGYLGNILFDLGDIEGAMSLHKDRESICRELGNVDSLQTCIGNQGLVLHFCGDLDGAMKLYKIQETVSREIGNCDSLQISLGNQGLVQKLKGDLDKANMLHKEEERICRMIGNFEGLQKSLGNQGNILFSTGDYHGAMKIHREVEELCRKYGNVDGLQTCLGNQGLVLKSQGDLDGAMKLHREQENICRALGNMDSLQTCLGNMGLIYLDRGNKDEAIKLFKEQGKLCYELGNIEGLQRSLGHQGIIHKDIGDYDGAMNLFEKSERLCRQIGLVDSLGVSLGNQGVILLLKGDLDGAMEFFKEEEKICRKVKNTDGLQICLCNQGNTLYSKGDLEEAMKYYKEAESICRQLGKISSLQGCLGNQGLIRKDQGDLDGAMKLYKEQEGICRKLGRFDDLQRCLGNQGSIFYSQGDFDGAIKLFMEEGHFCRELGNIDDLATSMINQATVLGLKMNSPFKALTIAEEALHIAEKHGSAGLGEQIRPMLERIRAKIQR